MADRIEVMIERWSNPDKTTDFRWSVWRAGNRIQMGGPHDTAAASEQDAVAFCRQNFQRPPDRIEHL